jgi:hypothetical protein
MQSLKSRHLGTTLYTPGRAEVEQHNLSCRVLRDISLPSVLRVLNSGGMVLREYGVKLTFCNNSEKSARLHAGAATIIASARRISAIFCMAATCGFLTFRRKRRRGRSLGQPHLSFLADDFLDVSQESLAIHYRRLRII